jgi:hypothetical protein
MRNDICRVSALNTTFTTDVQCRWTVGERGPVGESLLCASDHQQGSRCGSDRTARFRRAVAGGTQPENEDCGYDLFELRVCNWWRLKISCTRTTGAPLTAEALAKPLPMRSGASQASLGEFLSSGFGSGLCLKRGGNASDHTPSLKGSKSKLSPGSCQLTRISFARFGGAPANTDKKTKHTREGGGRELYGSIIKADEIYKSGACIPKSGTTPSSYAYCWHPHYSHCEGALGIRLRLTPGR